ncbi:uncharacterized protein LOC133301957 [Gastrolobium bilobum]|uniref:uncharacterized protein LOC133301957 n=1 Tax=Gastrolobium bilobum TaxID=150636 RepID=UPI002AB03162|nr:uncharacterized protein LOC133301957 [Gastrolobium bilobum]
MAEIQDLECVIEQNIISQQKSEPVESYNLFLPPPMPNYYSPFQKPPEFWTNPHPPKPWTFPSSRPYDQRIRRERGKQPSTSRRHSSKTRMDITPSLSSDSTDHRYNPSSSKRTFVTVDLKDQLATIRTESQDTDESQSSETTESFSNTQSSNSSEISSKEAFELKLDHQTSSETTSENSEKEQSDEVLNSSDL